MTHFFDRAIIKSVATAENPISFSRIKGTVENYEGQVLPNGQVVVEVDDTKIQIFISTCVPKSGFCEDCPISMNCKKQLK